MEREIAGGTFPLRVAQSARGGRRDDAIARVTCGTRLAVGERKELGHGPLSAALVRDKEVGSAQLGRGKRFGLRPSLNFFDRKLFSLFSKQQNTNNF